MSPPVQVLFLAANPDHTARLRLDREIRAMEAVLREAEHRQCFQLCQEWAVEYADLQGTLLRNRPQVVHFSGHGGAEEGVILETAARHVVPVTAADDSPSSGDRPPSPNLTDPRGKAVADLFSIVAESDAPVRCVVLNACFSAVQARAISRHVGCVVGMSRAVDDRHAISFSQGFYRALFAGASVASAFRLGCNQIDLVHRAGGSVPRLLPGLDDPAGIELLSEHAADLGGRLAAGVAALHARSFEAARDLLAPLVKEPDAPSQTDGYLAMARLAGRSFNALHPVEREEIEARLHRARRKDPEWDLPPLVLHALEIDFYELHGLTSGHGYGPPAPAHPVDPVAPASEETRELLGAVSLSRRARKRLARSLSPSPSPSPDLHGARHDGPDPQRQ
jgi:hypothetical protein